jgi:Cytochrome c7 and related cytochrome c
MSGNGEGKVKRHEGDYPRLAAMVAALLVVLTLSGIGFYYFFFEERVGPVQPIPFSHHVHTYVKKIGCLMCHPTAPYSERAGIPPLQTCMLCHSRIIIHYPWIAKLREHYFSGRPVAWERVNYLPEFVYFNHSVHIQAGIDCGKCHGDVKMMDRIQPAVKFEMGFCIGCHRKNKATHDCFTCHR